MEGTIQLDFYTEGQLRRMVFQRPVKVLIAQNAAEVRPLLREVQAGVASGLYAAGYLSYEASPAFDPAFRVHPKPQMPLAWFGLYEKPQQDLMPSEEPGTYQISSWSPSLSRGEYERRIGAIREAIACGETYQTNYTLRLRADFSGDDYAFYQDLCRRQNGSYSAYLNLGRFRILSASPELFFHWNSEKLVTKPMKGTVKRGRWPEEDRQNAAWLAHSEKNQAENVMIVDLLRNDLGMIAEVGSVHVPHLFDIERYRTVYQMTSTVEATPKQGTTLEDVFGALFPCGSITGAPKVNTMKWIAELENTPREVYCGSIGYIAPDHEAIFNVAIRTVLLDTATGTATYGVGGGITWDSQAADEYEETIAKSAILTAEAPSFELLETMKLEDGRYDLSKRHRERILASAEYFNIPLQAGELLTAMDAYANEHSAGVFRVRLLVSKQGTVRLESTPLAPQPPLPPQPVALATEPIDSGNPFFFHKTTYRDIYQVHREAHPDVFDVLLWNERRELTEFTIGNLVLELDGERVTPPIASGLLPGTLRAELLDQGVITERTLTIADLNRATAVWLINSVRGWVPVYQQ